MQIIIACVGCAKRFVTDDTRLAKEMVCPQCGGAMKSAPRLNVKKPTKSHMGDGAETTETFVEKLERFPSAGLPPQPELKIQKPPMDPAKKVAIIGGVAVGAILLFGIGLFVYRMVMDEESPIAVWSGSGRSRSSNGGDEADPAGSATSKGATVAPDFVPAPVPVATEPPKASKSPLEEFVDKYGDGVVRLTMLDGEGKPSGTANGVILARRKVSAWSERDARPDREAARGDLWVVATSYHGVVGASDVEVRQRDGTTQKARGLAAYDRQRDVALLALDAAPAKLTVFEPAPRGSAKPGDDVIALGCSSGGVVGVRGVVEGMHHTSELSADFRDVARSPADQMWIETTAVPAGGTGAPLFTTSGKLLGVTAWSIDEAKKRSAAIGVDHVAVLDGLTFDAELPTHRVQVLPFSAVSPIDLTVPGEDRHVKTDEEVRRELDRLSRRAIEDDWRLRTKGDYVTYQSLATGLAVAAARGWAVPELKLTADSLSQRRWDYDADIRPINRYAIENLAEEQWGVFFFGKVRRINPASPRHLIVDLLGRGYSAAVTIPAGRPAPNVKVGDDLIVLGQRFADAPKSKAPSRDAHDILAGLVLNLSLPPLPTDVALQTAYDLARTDRESPAFGQAVRQFADTYDRAVPLVGKAGMRWQRFNLNTRGHQFDAVRFTVPPGLNCDLIWSFNSPEESVEAWGLMPVGNFPMRESGNSFTSQGQPVPQLAKEESQHVVLQSSTGGLLVPGEDYLLWFALKDAKPRRLAIVARVVPTGSFDPQNLASAGRAMQDGQVFPPAETAKMLQLLKERAASGPDGKPPRPTPSASATSPSATPAPTPTGAATTATK